MMLQQNSGNLAESFHYEIRNTFIHIIEEDDSALTRSKSSPAILFDGKTRFCAPNSKEGPSIPDSDDDGVLYRLIKEMQRPLELVATARDETPQEFAVPPPRLDKKFFGSAASTTASETYHAEVLFEPAMHRRQGGLHGQWLWDKTLDDGCMSRRDFKSKSARGMGAFPNFDPGDGHNAEIIPQECEATSWNSAYPTTQPMVYMMPVSEAPNYVSCLPLQVPPVAPVRPSNNQQYAQRGPALGNFHNFHLESRGSGELSEDCRTFTKKEYQGRLSVITEAEMHSGGITRHVIQFTKGELSAADGVGFVFSRTLPCPKNIKRITSIFVNRSGRICLRGGSVVVRSNTSVSKLRVGDWIEMTVDLQKMVASFVVWPASGMCPSSAVFSFGSALSDLNIQVSRQGQPVCGYLACVVQNLGVTIAFRS